MSLRFPNLVQQSAVYNAGGGTPYVDVSSGSAAADAYTLPAKAVSDSWADGDTVGVHVIDAAGNKWVGTAIWGATLQRVTFDAEEESTGTLPDGAAVTLTAVTTGGALELLQAVAIGVELVEESTTARTLTTADHGQTIRCTSASAVTITPDETLPVGFHCLIVQEGAGTPSIAPDGSDTLNGATDSVDVAGQYKSAYIYKPSAGALVVVA